VRGNLASGEIFANNWAAKRQDPGAGVQDFADDLHAFYASLAATWLPDDTTITQCSVKILSSGITVGLTWATITGANTQEALPTQLGVRVSLYDGDDDLRGGPFLPGWSKQATTAGGLVDATVQSDIIDALDALNTAVQADNWTIGIQSPTQVMVGVATSARVGQRWDVIRKRANDVAESYASTEFF